MCMGFMDLKDLIEDDDLVAPDDLQPGVYVFDDDGTPMVVIDGKAVRIQ